MYQPNLLYITFHLVKHLIGQIFQIYQIAVSMAAIVYLDFESIMLCVVFLFLFGCLSVSRISQKVVDRFE